jgi:ribosomal-protein-alanine N-acetyltransferase
MSRNVTVDLAPIRKEDLAQMLEWRNDWRIMDWTRQSDYIDEFHHETWFEGQSADPAIRMYRVMMRTDGKTSFVGVCGLTSIDWRIGRAEFSLYIAPAFHKLGIGSMALRVLLNHAFQNLGLWLVWGETLDGNPAVKMFEKIGFIKEGTRRQFYWKGGRRVDAHLISITREEWHARVSGHGPSPGDHPGTHGDDGVKPDPGHLASPSPPPKAARKRRGLAAVIDTEVVGGSDDQTNPEGADRGQQ